MADPSLPEGEAEPREPVDDELPRIACVSSEELLQGGRELWILHAGQVYRLMLTRNNKLILQK